MSESSKSLFENINDLIKALLWPLIVMTIFISYKESFDSIIELIPDKLKSSSKISIGSLSFEIEKKAQITGNKELGKIINNLSEQGIRELLSLGSGGSYMIVSTDEYANTYTFPQNIEIFKELEDKKLIEFTEPADRFSSFFSALHPKEQKMYRCKSGSYSTGKSKDCNSPFIQKTVSKSKLNKEEIERIKSFGVSLSPTGKKAFDIIVQVTSEQIDNK